MSHTFSLLFYPRRSKCNKLGEHPLYAKQNGWKLSSSLPPDAEFEAHLKHLESRLLPIKDKLELLKGKYYSELAIAVSFNEGESTPWVHFTKESVDFFASLGAEIDFDFYLLP